MQEAQIREETRVTVMYMNTFNIYVLYMNTRVSLSLSSLSANWLRGHARERSYIYLTFSLANSRVNFDSTGHDDLQSLSILQNTNVANWFCFLTARYCNLSCFSLSCLSPLPLPPSSVYLFRSLFVSLVCIIVDIFAYRDIVDYTAD